MQQIRQAIKRKQSQLAQLAKEIELLQQAEEKLREIAPLLAAEGEEDEGTLLAEVEDEATPPAPAVMTASASAGQAPAVEPEAEKPVALRWP